jgi:tetratricopeptide (TPR) repeat protein
MSRFLRPWLAALVLALIAPAISADRLYLESGGHIDTDSWWVENGWLMYDSESGTIGIPRSAVVRIDRGEQAAAPATPARPSRIEADRRSELRENLERARKALEDRDYEMASAYYLSVINEEPGLNGARIGYAVSEVALGRDGMALSIVLDGLAREPENPQLREILGDLRYREERIDDALREWRQAFEKAPADRLRDKILKGERELHASRDYDFKATPHFNMRYDGDVDLDLAAAVMDYLEEQYWVVTDAFNHSPSQPITVQLFPTREFREVTQAPEWVGGLYDGKIRVPLGGLSTLTARAKRVLIHELTHAVVHSKSRGNCPRWLHEGLAQRAEKKKLTPSQIGEIVGKLAGSDAISWDAEGFSYPMALSLTRHIESRQGFGGLVLLLELLGGGAELDAALMQLYRENYSAICKRWKSELAEEAVR